MSTCGKSCSSWFSCGIERTMEKLLEKKEKRTPILIYWNNILVMFSLNVQLHDLET